MTQTVKRATGDAVDYTPGSAVLAGAVVVQNDLVGMSPADIPANKLGALEIEGIWRFPKAENEGAIAVGKEVFWDEDGNPDGGTAGSGAATETSSGNTKLGISAIAAASGGTTVDVKMMPGSNSSEGS